MPHISSNAIIEPSARLARDVRVGPFTYIGPDVTIERGCIIENNVTITGKTVIGQNTHVYPLAVIGESANGSPKHGACIIGRNNAVREQVTVYAGTDEANPTRIGDDNLIMIACQIGSAVMIANNSIFANCTLIEAGATVEDYVRASALCTIQAGVTVGAYTFIGGYTTIDHDAPPFAMLQGSPYRIRGINSHNLTRCGFTDEDIHALKNAFRELFDPATRCVDTDAMKKLLCDKNLNARVRRLLDAVQRDLDRTGDVR